MTQPYRIDVHQHVLPPRLVKAIGEDEIGKLLVSGKAPQWTAQSSLEMMDRQGIAKAYVSMSAPGVAGFSQDKAIAAIQDYNDDVGDICRDHPARFGAFAALPMPYIEPTLAEIERAYDVIGVDGSGVFSNYGGRYIGDPVFFPVLEELNHRKAVLFVHPDEGPASAIEGVPAATLDFPFDTSRAIVSLLVSGALKRFPDIKFIFAHAGGTVPFLAERIARLERIEKHKDALKGGVVPLLQKLYFDTALSANKYIFASLRELVSAEHILFGSDYPFAREDTTIASIKGLAGLNLPQSELHNIETANAKRLLHDAGPASLLEPEYVSLRGYDE